MDEERQDSIGYAFNGKIMISSVAVLFVACFVIILFHVYAHWFRRRPVRHLHHHNRHSRHLNTSATVVSSQGLDLCAMNSLPTFIYESKNRKSPLECAVCLSEFEDYETGRTLPECKHCFHIDCIDMWLQSHCDCPLCRAQVQVQAIRNPAEPIEDPHDGTVSINVSEDMGSGSGSALHPTCQSEGIHMGCSSSSRTPDVPRQLTGPIEQDPPKNEGAPDSDRNLGSDIESGSKTPASSDRVLRRLFSI